MRRILNMIMGLAAVIFTAAACQKDDEQTGKTVDAVVVGQWHLIGASAEGTSIMQDVDVYLCINADCTFELYQKSGSQSHRYDRYTGTCSTEGGVLTGAYSNGKAWGGKYTYLKTTYGIILKTTNRLEEQRYQACEIPASVKDGANPVGVKSSVTGSPIL